MDQFQLLVTLNFRSTLLIGFIVNYLNLLTYLLKKVYKQ